MRPLLIALLLGIGLFTESCASSSHTTGKAMISDTTSKRDIPQEETIHQVRYLNSDLKNSTDELIQIDLTDEPARISQSEETQALGLPELIELTLDSNPRLGEVSWAIETARGRAIQAGLYPNPTVNVTGNEISDRTGPGGIWTAYAGQEFVTANKLGLDQAAALKRVDQASLKLMTERYQVFTKVRQAYFEALTLQKRADILSNLVKLAEKSVNNSKALLKAEEAAELDVIQLEIDLERYGADLDATRKALPGAYRKLAASVGIQDMPIKRLSGDLDSTLQEYNLDQISTYVLSIHPEIRSAQIGVEHARLILQRAKVEPIPNITVGTGYTHQGQNRSDDWDIGFSVPLPLWNKNQGNILSAETNINVALNQTERVQNELMSQLAIAYSAYASARERAERYQVSILPKAQRTYDLSMVAYQGGQFEYLRVLEAQRSVAEANLELIRSMSEMWLAASEIAGLMLEDQWPLAPVPPLPEKEQS